MAIIHTVDTPKQELDHMLRYMAQSAISSAPNPPATTNFWWLPPLKSAVPHASVPLPRPKGVQQAAIGSPKRWVPKWVNKVHHVQKIYFL